MSKRTWIIIVVSIVVLAGIIGYVLYNRSQKKKAAALKAKTTGKTPVDTTNKPGTDPGAGKPFSNLSPEQNMGYVMDGERLAGT